MTEAFAKSFLIGVLIGASVELAFSIVMHLLSSDPGWLWIGIVFVVPFFLVSVLLFGFVYYPTQKRVAKRLDEAGLQERASTMIQFKGQESNILEMQRMDATKHIEEMDIKQLRCGVSLKILIAGIIVFALSIGCMFVLKVEIKPLLLWNVFLQMRVIL